ncbi:ABC transporter ATP-binding protein [Streptomyces sp. QL37]|uniref:ABC transporter ATP-binding protein n=1 Tax=Streptomyces sp. QL37 TaxID=2093747 RepID=UPI000CF2F83A|nr:ABC transporter ATP-binding protein [Streptomyces sp. QL37]PPQ61170.1 ABC transporter [Streptomyces sp. QL37]
MTGAPGEALVRACGLRKSYRGHEAVSGVDFTVRRGESVGLLGPNGAGKSSLMRMIGCVSRPDGGELRVLGMDPATQGPRVRGRLGVVHQHDCLDSELSPRRNLYAYARFFGLSRREARERTGELLAFARLTDRADSAVETLSGGMSRRLAIVRALVNSPDLLILDEPTTGLDPQARQLIWQQLRLLKKGGVSLIVTSHYMDEVEELCDRVQILDRGRTAAEGTPAALTARHAAPEVVEIRWQAGEDAQVRDAMAGLASHVEMLPDRTLVYVDEGERVLARLRDRGIRPDFSLVRKGSLEDVFLRLTGRALVG